MSYPVTRIALVTGATTGIGFETARQLLGTGSRVVLHGPTMIIATKAAARLADLGVNPDLVEVVAADFTRLDEVRAMADEVADRYGHLDLLVNNAATAAPESRAVTTDGNELTFQVNYLAHYLLTRMLAELLRAAPQGRAVALSSTHHRSANLDWSDPQRRHRYTPLAAYAQSKLALTMLARALAARDLGFEAVSVHPGIVETGLAVHYGRSPHSVEDVAASVTRLCSPSTHVCNGAYYDRLAVAPAAVLADNAKAVDRVWKLSARLVGLDLPVPTVAARSE
jgi:NAD(P)-dependent dehydrogenase (short-subunit alcohol dehydrogenase family)